MFYSEDALIAQAIQNSLMQQNGEENPDAMFNKAINQAMVDSKKEFDDVDRRKAESEISKIKDDPTALQAKTAAILSKASPAKGKLAGLTPLGPTPGNAKQTLKLDPLAAPVAAKNKVEDVVKPIGTADRPKVMNKLEERAESPIKPTVETAQTREEIKDTIENPLGSDEHEKSSPVKEPTTSKEKDAEELEELLDELESDNEKPKAAPKVESPPQEPVVGADELEESVEPDDEMENMLRKVAENNNPNEIKKTQKIISNQPVDENEFSYFNKDKGQKTTSSKPKMEGADDDDLNLFSNPPVETKKTSRDADNDSFDFEF